MNEPEAFLKRNVKIFSALYVISIFAYLPVFAAIQFERDNIEGPESVSTRGSVLVVVLVITLIFSIVNARKGSALWLLLGLPGLIVAILGIYGLYFH